MSVSTSLYSQFHWVPHKQAPDALEESTSGDRAPSVFMYLQVIKLNSFKVNPRQMNSAVFVFI